MLGSKKVTCNLCKLTLNVLLDIYEKLTELRLCQVTNKYKKDRINYKKDKINYKKEFDMQFKHTGLARFCGKGKRLRNNIK